MGGITTGVYQVSIVQWIERYFPKVDAAGSNPARDTQGSLGIGSKRLGQHLLSVALRGIHGFAPVQDEIRTQPELR